MLKNWNTKAIDAYTYQGDGKPVRLKDPMGNGLTLKVTAKSKTWVVQVRVGDKNATLTLGKWKDMGLSEARQKAAEVQQEKSAGTLLLAPVAPPTAKQGSVAKTTCQDWWDTWLAELKAGTCIKGRKEANKPSTLAGKQHTWDKVFKDAIGHKALTSVTENDLLDIIEEIRDEGHFAKANTAIRYIRAFFRWAKLNKRKTGLTYHPGEDILPSKTKARQRALDEMEIRLLFAALEDEAPVWADLYRLAILTGMRRGEVVGLHRGEIFQLDRSLDLPAARMKPDRPHRFPVGPEAWSIVLRRLAATNSEFLFPISSGTGPINGFSSIQQRIRENVEKAGAKVGKKVEHWTFHDLRRTFSTHANRLREGTRRAIDKDIIERCLTHTLGGVEGVYDCNDYFEDKQRAWAKWEGEVSRIVGASLHRNIEKQMAAAA